MAKIGDKVNPQRLQSFQKEVSRSESLVSSVDWGLLLQFFVLIGLVGVGWFSGGFSGCFYLNAISEATIWSRVIAGTIIGASVGTLLLLVALNLCWTMREADSSERFYGTSIAPVLGGGGGAIAGSIVAAMVGTHYLEMFAATAWGGVLIGSLVGALAGTVALVGLRVLGERGLRIFSLFPLGNELVSEPLKWRALLPPHESFLAILLYELPFLFWLGGLSGAIAGAIFSQF